MKIDLTKLVAFIGSSIDEVDFGVIVEGYAMVAAGASIEESLIYVWLAHHAKKVAEKTNKPLAEVKGILKAVAEAAG